MKAKRDNFWKQYKNTKCPLPLNISGPDLPCEVFIVMIPASLKTQVLKHISDRKDSYFRERKTNRSGIETHCEIDLRVQDWHLLQFVVVDEWHNNKGKTTLFLNKLGL
jgi:hypothetical protein